MKQRELEATRFFKNDNEKEEVKTQNNEESEICNTINHNVFVDKTSPIEKLYEEDLEIKDKEIDTSIAVSKDGDYFDGLVAIEKKSLINKETPRLTGEGIINLESDCTTSPIMSGAKELFDRFIKQQNPRSVGKLE